jgi:predicted ATP-grasp superfamily ATP-dependent carboligase
MVSTVRTQFPSNPKQAGAIVLGGNFVGLGVARSLGAKGIRTWVLDSDRSKSIAQFSRYTERFLEVKESVVDALLGAAREHHLEGWVLIPVTDDYVELLSAHHEALSAVFRVSAPTSDVTRFALDKRLTYQLAQVLGIDTPWTAVCRSVAELDAENVPYPVILKPAINHHFFPHTNLKALAVDDPRELRHRFAQMSHYIPPEEILIQERIPGGGENQYSFCGISQDGHAYGAFVAQRRRQYPVDFGNASTFVETVDQPIVEAGGRRFFEAIGLNGLAEIEFKFDPRDGKYKILDVNPRIWGWHTLGKAAGIDFPYLLWRQNVGLPAPALGVPRNAAWIREITDAVAILKSRSRGTELQRVLRALLQGRLTSASLNFLDPVPFFAEFALWISSGVSRQKKAKEFLQPTAADTRLPAAVTRDEVTAT